LRTKKRFGGSGQNLARILLVQKNRANRVFPNGADAMGQQEPAFVQLDGRSAIAQLHEFPSEFGLQDDLATFPCVEIIGIKQIEILIVLPADHCVMAVDLAREQRHPLVARRQATERRQAEGYEVGGLDQFGSYGSAAI